LIPGLIENSNSNFGASNSKKIKIETMKTQNPGKLVLRNLKHLVLRNIETSN
jgi:hypothetical protein